MSNRIISPISIDLGAKNTGVYFTHYEEGSSIEEIEKEGKVYILEKDKYTLLMVNRTAARHQRRGYDRRQMVKRLFKLIWEKHLNLEWDKDVQQTTSFLLNRRGFTFLTEEYDEKALQHFPKEAHDLLPDELKIDAGEGEEYDFSSALSEWTNDGQETVRKIYEAINREPKRIAERQVFISRTKKLKDYCETREKGEEITEKPGGRGIKLSQLSKWIWDEWKQKEVQGLDENFVAKNDDGSEINWRSVSIYNLVAYLNKQPPDTACKILDSLPDTSKEDVELKESAWYFKSGSFDFEKEKAKFDQTDHSDGDGNQTNQIQPEWIKVHLHHLAYALYKTLNELESGGRHRSKYFDEVRKALRNERTKGRKKDGIQIGDDYIDRFCTKLKSGHYQRMNEEKLSHLIGHLSNLELKPLRKYFNDKKHQKSDYWCEAHLNRIFDRWILQEWRVNRKKDKDKAADKPGDYNKLRKNWSEHKKLKPNTVVDFWLETDPFLTIPPYQDNNNRRPPKCQSLILNPKFLDKKYPDWQSWLEELKSLEAVAGYLDDFEDQLLKDLKSGKRNPYFSDKKAKEVTKKGKEKSRQELKAGNQERRTLEALDARVLQFIFDRVKKNDPLKLNEIYSHAKKWRQKQSTEQDRQAAKEKLEESIKESKLPDGLITDSDYSNEGLFEEGTFLHLVCNYYKQRQRAKAGRLFIHPEYRPSKDRGHVNTGRFDDKNCLLTYCNHKPRQKKYQSFYDIAGVLQVSPAHLQQIIGGQSDDTDDTLVPWLKKFHGLPKLCQDSADAQKEHRGILKTQMDSAIRGKRKNDPLYKLNTSLEKIAKEVGKALFAEVEERALEKKIEKFRSPFSFAQINNIAFKDRSGNSNTCAVCSADNAHRMQIMASKDQRESNAKSQRLPSIPTRLIDGAVMRMTRIVGGAIADDKWEKIETELKAGRKVSVPIITESNRFEFEPSLKEIKGKNLKDTDKENREKGQEKLACGKNERITAASQNVCPYTGKELSENTADRDHIIPRSSEWGTLNDEANLIWASVEGNREVKQDNEFSLANLKSNYKRKQFGTDNDKEIEKQIEKDIWDKTNEIFTFGRYRSFINLTHDQQKAFRHALFLIGHPLREKVINAIDNRNRTLVNGTQRYFAEVIANNLHKKARAIGKQNLLSFDFFEVEAQPNTRGDGIKELRTAHEEACLLDEKYTKQKGQKQLPYSHLIDAQLAFCMMADAHKNEGSLKLAIHEHRLWPLDKSTDEMFQKTIFGAVHITPEQLCEKHLERKRPDQKLFSHRSIHRDGIYAECYTPILVHEEASEVRIGFNWDNSYELKDNRNSREKLYFALQFNLQGRRLELPKAPSFQELKSCLIRNGFRSNAGYFCIPLNVQAIHDYYVKTYNTSKGYKKWDDNTKFLHSLSYRTEKRKITTLEEAKEVLNNTKNFQIHKHITLPAREEWKRLIDVWEKTQLEDNVFLKCFFKVPETKSPHEKVRKVFSLPVKSGQGKFLIKRNSWDGNSIFQVVNDSDSRKVDAKAFVPVFIKSKNQIGELLSGSACSKRLFRLVDEEYQDQISSEISEIDPCRWFPVTVPDELCKFVNKIEYRIDNNTRPQIRFTPSNKLSSEQIDVILGNSLLKPRDKQALKTQIQEVDGQGGPIEYTGTGLNKEIKKLLSPVLTKHYQ